MPEGRTEGSIRGGGGIDAVGRRADAVVGAVSVCNRAKPGADGRRVDVVVDIDARPIEEGVAVGDDVYTHPGVLLTLALLEVISLPTACGP